MKVLLTTEKTTKDINLLNKQDFYFERCGRILAMRKNFYDSFYYLSHLYPQSQHRLKEELDHLLDKLPTITEEKKCAATHFPGLYAFPHKQENPRLPFRWPNWVARYAFSHNNEL